MKNNQNFQLTRSVKRRRASGVGIGHRVASGCAVTVRRTRGTAAVPGSTAATGNNATGTGATALSVGVGVTGTAIASGSAAGSRGATAAVSTATSGSRGYRRRAI